MYLVEANIGCIETLKLFFLEQAARSYAEELRNSESFDSGWDIIRIYKCAEISVLE